MIGQSMIENLVFATAMMIPNQTNTFHPARTTAIAAQIPEQWKPFAKCVVNRESNGNPRAQNPVSSAQGKYQFLDNAWRHGAGWNVYSRLKNSGMPRVQALTILRKLHSTPIKHWREEYQDAAFVFVILTPGGWRHWTGGHGCNSLVPTK
jgi:hypothetical protein